MEQSTPFLMYPNAARYNATYGFNQREPPPPPVIVRRRVDEWFLLLLAVRKSHQQLPPEVTQQVLSLLVDRCYECTQCQKAELTAACIVIPYFGVALCSKDCEETYLMRRYPNRYKWGLPERYIGEN